MWGVQGSTVLGNRKARSPRAMMMFERRPESGERWRIVKTSWRFFSLKRQGKGGVRVGEGDEGGGGEEGRGERVYTRIRCGHT